MIRAIVPLLLASAIAFGQAPPAQPGQTQPAPQQPGQQQPPAQTNRAIWRVNLPGGTYELVIPAMLGVSSHEYVIDGVARVTEVNVDTTGQIAVRFYAIEPLVTSGPGGIGAASIGKLQSVMTEAADRAGTDAWKKVVKNYPTTTHQRTVEYRVSGKESLNRIFSSASKALRTGKADELSISE